MDFASGLSTWQFLATAVVKQKEKSASKNGQMEEEVRNHKEG